MLATVAAVILLGSGLIFGSAPTVGLDREKGEYWTYEMSTTMVFMGMQVEVTGPVTYAFKGQSPVTIGENVYSSNVLTLDGTLSGPVQILSQDLGSAEVSMAGSQYELVGGIGILKDDLTSAADVTLGAGVFSFTYHFQEQVTVATTPPILSEFHPETTDLGDRWTQAVTVNTTVETWENGTLVNTTTEIRTLTYDAAVSSTLEPLETPAGTFETVRVQVTDSDGNYEIFWWSSEVNNIVKHETHENGSSSPVLTMTLTGFGTKSSSTMLTVALVGVSVLAIAVAVLVFVLLKVRRPREPQSASGAASEPGAPAPDALKTDASR
jgi:hypothetical protein